MNTESKKRAIYLFTWKGILRMLCILIAIAGFAVWQDYRKQGYLTKHDMVLNVVVFLISILILISVVWYGNSSKKEDK